MSCISRGELATLVVTPLATRSLSFDLKTCSPDPA